MSCAFDALRSSALFLQIPIYILIRSMEERLSEGGATNTDVKRVLTPAIVLQPLASSPKGSYAYAELCCRWPGQVVYAEPTPILITMD